MAVGETVFISASFLVVEKYQKAHGEIRVVSKVLHNSGEMV